VQTSDEDTKKSFDLTGELNKLNESGASDRASFVELAFKTLPKSTCTVDLGRTYKSKLRRFLACHSLDDKADSFASYAVSSDFDAPSQSHSQLPDVKQPNAFQDTPEQEDILSHNIGAEFSYLRKRHKWGKNMRLLDVPLLICFVPFLLVITKTPRDE